MSWSTTASALPAQQNDCSFSLGFDQLRAQIPDLVGDCLENEWYDGVTGDALQQTTGGLLVWRKADNWTAFTDGSTTWINGPFRLQSRLNTQRFDWEASSAEVSASAPSTAPPGVSPAVDTAGIPFYPEIRPENTTANGTRPQLEPWQWSGGGNNLRPYYDRITGDYQGTTEQILEWAARKWGFDKLGYGDLARAVAVKESTWRQSHRGEFQEAKYYYSPHPTYPSPDYQSYGISQVKRTVWPGSYPNSVDSTAYAADYWAAVVRMAYDGQSWRGASYGGDIWRAVQFWFDSGGDPKLTYAQAVQNIYETRQWAQIRP